MRNPSTKFQLSAIFCCWIRGRHVYVPK